MLREPPVDILLVPLLRARTGKIETCIVDCATAISSHFSARFGTAQPGRSF